MVTLIETRYECRPCSGGFPVLIGREWDIKEFPGLFVHLSYYRGYDVLPLPSLSIRNKADNVDAPQTKLLSGIMARIGIEDWNKKIPLKYEIEDMVSIALAD